MLFVLVFLRYVSRQFRWLQSSMHLFVFYFAEGVLLRLTRITRYLQLCLLVLVGWRISICPLELSEVFVNLLDWAQRLPWIATLSLHIFNLFLGLVVFRAGVTSAPLDALDDSVHLAKSSDHSALALGRLLQLSQYEFGAVNLNHLLSAIAVCDAGGSASWLEVVRRALEEHSVGEVEHRGSQNWVALVVERFWLLVWYAHVVREGLEALAMRALRQVHLIAPEGKIEFGVARQLGLGARNRRLARMDSDFLIHSRRIVPATVEWRVCTLYLPARTHKLLTDAGDVAAKSIAFILRIVQSVRNIDA